MRKIAIFGGAFDPPTVSHFRVAKALLGITDEVWLLPCNVSYTGKKMVSGKERLKMCELAIQDFKEPRIKACCFEINSNLVGETYDILGKFLNHYRELNARFYFAIGMDNANSIETWTGHEKLINLVPFIILPRDGFTVKDDCWYTKFPHIIIKDFEPDTVSSTKVRQSIKESGNSDLITPSVLEYILSQKFYRD